MADHNNSILLLKFAYFNFCSIWYLLLTISIGSKILNSIRGLKSSSSFHQRLAEKSESEQAYEIHSELLIIYLIMLLELALWTCPLTLTYYRKCSLPGVDEVSSKILFVVLSVFIYAFTNLHLYEYLMIYCIQGWYMIKFEIVQTQKHIHFSVTIDCWILCVLNKLSFKNLTTCIIKCK